MVHIHNHNLSLQHKVMWNLTLQWTCSVATKIKISMKTSVITTLDITKLSILYKSVYDWRATSGTKFCKTKILYYYKVEVLKHLIIFNTKASSFYLKTYKHLNVIILGSLFKSKFPNHFPIFMEKSIRIFWERFPPLTPRNENTEKQNTWLIFGYTVSLKIGTFLCEKDYLSL